eukprot:362548-Chlamydomonas_euryale.AAC.1
MTAWPAAAQPNARSRIQVRGSACTRVTRHEREGLRKERGGKLGEVGRGEPPAWVRTWSGEGNGGGAVLVAIGLAVRRALRPAAPPLALR